jgi:hypothetical protein
VLRIVSPSRARASSSRKQRPKSARRTAGPGALRGEIDMSNIVFSLPCRRSYGAR